MPNPLVVHLGSRLILPWAAAPEEACHVLGDVSCGQEMGQLAVMPDGQYVQVNGSVVRPLNASRVNAAIRKAARRQNVDPRELMPRKAAPEPLVIVRKKRRIVRPD